MSSAPHVNTWQSAICTVANGTQGVFCDLTEAKSKANDAHPGARKGATLIKYLKKPGQGPTGFKGGCFCIFSSSKAALDSPNVFYCAQDAPAGTAEFLRCGKTNNMTFFGIVR
jgi:hypothetical protein